MIDLGEWLAALRGEGIEIWLDGEDLRYRARTALPADRLAELRARKAELRRFLGAARPDALPPIARVSRHDPIPLTLEQASLWSLDQALPGHAFSNVFAAYHLAGPLDVAALPACFDRIVQRHESLRTRFVVHAGQPAQVIERSPAVTLARLDVGALPAPQRLAACIERGVAEAQAPFDLAQLPLFRVVVVRFSDDEHVLLLTMHHIISDAWSLQVLARELIAAYSDHARVADTLAIQYADYAVWQRRSLADGALAAHRAYWRRQLGGELAPLALATDLARPAAMTFRTARETLVLPRAQVAAFFERGLVEGCTPYMSIVAALELLLHARTGQTDFRLATLVARRNDKALEPLIGLFVNTLLLRADLSGLPTLRDVLGRARRTVLEAYEHQELPFEDLLATIEADRAVERSTIAQVMLLFENAAEPLPTTRGITLSALDVKSKGYIEFTKTLTTFDLIFSVRDAPDALTIHLTYKTALFVPSTIRALLDELSALLRQAA